MLNSKIQFVYGSFVDSNFKYSVNEFGDVYSWYRPKKSQIQREFPKRIAQYRCSKGYQTVTMNGSRIRVHVLVAEAFHGTRGEGMVVRHLDGNQLNNKASNLSYGTRKDNSQDMVAHGRSTRGAKQPNSKLTESDVIEIVNMISENVNQKQIAEKFNVHEVTVRDIKRGKTWAHLNLWQQFTGQRTYNRKTT